MEIKNKKALAILLIVLGVIALFFMVRAFLDQKNEAKNTAVNTEIAEPGEAETAQESGNISTAATEDEVTFDNISSVLKYEIHPEIAELLDVERFDKELSSFLIEKKAINIASHELPTGIFLCTSTDYLTKDLRRNVYLFDLKLDNENKSIVSVSVSEEGYVFDIR